MITTRRRTEKKCKNSLKDVRDASKLHLIVFFYNLKIIKRIHKPINIISESQENIRMGKKAGF